MNDGKSSLKASRLGLIIPLVIFAIFFAAYSWIWMRGADMMQREIAAFAERETVAGRRLDYDAIKVEGYPFSLRGRLTRFRWSSPQMGAFSSDTMLIVAVPYAPDRIILSPRGDKQLTVRDETFDLEASDLRLSLQRQFIALEAHDLQAIGQEQTILIDDLIANQQLGDNETSYALQIKSLRSSQDTETEFQTIDLSALKSGENNGQYSVPLFALSLKRQGQSAPTRIVADGELTLISGQRPNGAIEIKLRNEVPMITWLSAQGILSAELADSVKSILGAMTEQGTKEIALPLTIDQGKLRLGMFPVGELPPL